MIRYRHYGPSKLTTAKHYGFCIESHSDRKAVDFYFGHHTFSLWIGNPPY